MLKTLIKKLLTRGEKEELLRNFSKDLVRVFREVKVVPGEGDLFVMTEGFAIDTALTQLAVQIIEECTEAYINEEL